MHTIYTNNNIHFLNTYKKNNMHFKIVRVEKELKMESGETPTGLAPVLLPEASVMFPRQQSHRGVNTEQAIYREDVTYKTNLQEATVESL